MTAEQLEAFRAEVERGQAVEAALAECSAELDATLAAFDEVHDEVSRLRATVEDQEARLERQRAMLVETAIKLVKYERLEDAVRTLAPWLEPQNLPVDRTQRGAMVYLLWWAREKAPKEVPE